MFLFKCARKQKQSELAGPEKSEGTIFFIEDLRKQIGLNLGAPEVNMYNFLNKYV